MKADDAVSAKFLDAAADGWPSNDAVQALRQSRQGRSSPRCAKAASEYAETVQKFQDMNVSWQSECKADPEFGGAKLPDTLATVRERVRQFPAATPK